MVATKLHQNLNDTTAQGHVEEPLRGERIHERSPLSVALKRTIDLAGAIFGLIVLSPLFAVIAILVKADSPGPALFAQRRIGKDSREFTFYKFRSMYSGCDDAPHRTYMARLIAAPSDGRLKGSEGCFKMENDPRVTRVGRFLRKSSLDELPQLINVLKGEMSLVGPRPALPYEVEMYEPWHARRLTVIPGMTGLWQVSGRSEKNFHEMTELDLKYIDDWSTWLDVKILIRTFYVIFNKQGAW